MARTRGIDPDDIVRLRIRGLSYMRIAKALGISERTVRYHLFMDATEDDPEGRLPGAPGNHWKGKPRRKVT